MCTHEREEVPGNEWTFQVCAKHGDTRSDAISKEPVACVLPSKPKSVQGVRAPTEKFIPNGIHKTMHLTCFQPILSGVPPPARDVAQPVLLALPCRPH